MSENYPIDDQGNPTDPGARSGNLFFINGQKLSIKYQLVEIQFTTTATVPTSLAVPISNYIQGVLLGSYIFSIEAYSAATLTVTPVSAGGPTVIPQAALTCSYMNLTDALTNILWTNKPLRDLQTINDTTSKAGKVYADALCGQKINWQNSNIFIAGANANLAASTSYTIPLGIAYAYNANFKLDGVGSKNLDEANANQ